jgi:EpsD family peptidyl-prolyl cis-trans isomerase
MLLALVVLSACDGKAKPAAGQSLARVDGTEITVHQLNVELEQIANATSQPASKKDVLDGLIVRQLLVEQAQKNKTDRDPNVMQAIERAREQILAQAYLKSRLNHVAQPSESEVEAFYQKNPQLFAQRQQFATEELEIATSDLSPELIETMKTARTLEQVQGWLQAHQIQYVPTQAMRSSVELPPQVVKAMSGMAPGQLFTIRQGEKSQLVALRDASSSPLTLQAARPKIVQFLLLQKSKEAADAEIARLRTAAKIEYLNRSDALDESPAAPASKTANADPKAVAPSAVERGVASLR